MSKQIELTFHLVPGCMVSAEEPGTYHHVGSRIRFAGMRFDEETNDYVSTGEAFSATARTPLGERYRRACKRGALTPADEATARFCGVPFSAPKKTPAPKKTSKTSKTSKRKANSA